MSNKDNLFDSFDAVSKTEWLEKVTKDLKGKPLESLQWQFAEDLQLSPFNHADDFERRPTNLSTKTNNDWLIGETFTVDDLKETNKNLLQALRLGANAPVLEIDRLLSVDELDQLFEAVQFEYITTHLKIAPSFQLELLKNFHQLITSRQTDGKLVLGSINGDKSTVFELLSFVSEFLPQFKVLEISTDQLDPVDSLTDLIVKGKECIATLREKEIKVDLINKHCQFQVELGTTYFIEIARIRALKLLWQNILHAYEANHIKAISITSTLLTQSLSDEANTNMIKATTQAMSAVIAGVDTLIVLPADIKDKKEGTDFSRRIARNVQHLLKMESYLDQVSDPAAGSYYIENLTTVLAEKAWENFQKM